MNVAAWSTTAATNTTTDSSLPTIADTMSPIDVDDTLRGMMAALKRYILDVGGAPAAVGGTANAITITTNQAISSAHQTLGHSIRFKAAGTNTTAVTVAVDGLAAVAIERLDGTALEAGDIVSGGIYDIAYNTTNSGYTLMGAAATAVAVASTNLGATSCSFSAHKGGTDQEVSTTSATKITFSTEAFDVGSRFSSSTWTPLAGTVLMTAAIALRDNADYTKKILIYKNGSEFKRCLLREDAGFGTLSTFISFIDQANGTDTYDLYVELASDSSYTVDGESTQTFFMGTMV